MATLKQVAERAGVSTRSASVVLNGKAVESRISEEVTQKIIRIAKELNYQPNAMARAVRLKKTNQIGVLVRELSNPYTGAIVEEIESSLLKHGYKLLLGLTNRSPSVAKSYLREFSMGMVDGILNLDPDLGEADFIACQVPLPYVNFMRSSPKVSLSLDYEEGMLLGLDHLWALGHRRIGFVSGPKIDVSTDGRLLGYLNFLKSKGAVSPAIEYGNWSFESGRKAVAGLLEKACTAIFSANDLMAVGTIKELTSRGLSIPGDVSVVGFDDSMLAQMADPSLTSVHVPMKLLAGLSVTGLVAHIQGQPDSPARVIKPTLVVRDSSGVAKEAHRT